MELTPLEKAIIQVESGGDDYAIGDNGKAFGCMQIWDVYMEDAFPSQKRKGKECLGNRDLSILAFRKYMARYATKKRLGRDPTPEDIARIHNGGPNGYKKVSTVKYWKKVEKTLQENNNE